MENKVIVYDKVLKVMELSNPNEVDKYLSSYSPVDDSTCLVWDLITCLPSNISMEGNDYVVYILGQKYKHIDHTNK